MSRFDVELVRGEVVESVHRVQAAMVGPGGECQMWGDGRRPVIPRSAVKFVQAMPILTTGAAERYDVTDVELALAASSHSGEPVHVTAVRHWLDRIGLDESALACGPDLPIDAAAARDLHRRGLDPAPVYNCCSGKHAGFLTVARHLGVDPEGYIEPDHPVQRLVTSAIETMTGVDLGAQRPGRDGCGIPVFAIPVEALARAMQLLVDPVGLPADMVTAARRMTGVPAGRQFWVSGTGRHEVVLGATVAEPLVVKGGAEGVFVAALPERRVGIALKVFDGAGRAAAVAVSALLSRLGALPPTEVERPVHNKAGVLVGSLRAVLGEPDRS